MVSVRFEAFVCNGPPPLYFGANINPSTMLCRTSKAFANHGPPNAGTHTLDQALFLFGTPASVTAFLRSNRGVDSDVDDTFTIILQYSGAQKNLLVTVKTAVVTHMEDQLRLFVRGTKGSFLKVCFKLPSSPLLVSRRFKVMLADDEPQRTSSAWTRKKPRRSPRQGNRPQPPSMVLRASVSGAH